MTEPDEIEVLIGDGAGTRAPSDVSLIADVTDIEIGGENLRRFLRDIIGKFFVSSPPIEPSLSKLLSIYLMDHSEEFRKVRDAIVSSFVAMDASKSDSQKYRALLSDYSGLMSRRDEIINQSVVSQDFRRSVSLAKANYNDEKRAFMDMADCLERLKPYLGLPVLPNIKVPSVEPLIILQAIQELENVKPLPNEMVMMGEEPFYSYVQFSARSVYHTGIHPKIANTHIFIPFSKESMEGNEAVLEGAFPKAGRLSFKVVDHRPAVSSDWRKIDSLLPFAARSITVPLVPLVMPSSVNMVDIPMLFGSQWWNGFHSEIISKHANVCQICGGIKDVEATPSWRFIEPPKDTVAPGLMILDTFYLMCIDCRFAFRPSLEKSFSHKSGKLIPNTAIRDRISVLNRWTDPSAQPYAEKAYEMMVESFKRRSAIRWLVNLSLLSNQPLNLNPAFIIDENGWIKNEAIRHDPFKIVGVSFYDRSTERHLFPAPKVFRTKWGHNLSEAIEFVNEATGDLVFEDTSKNVNEEEEVAEDDVNTEIVPLSEDEDSAEIRVEDFFGRQPVEIEDEDDFDDGDDDDEEVSPDIAEIERQMAASEIKFD